MHTENMQQDTMQGFEPRNFMLQSNNVTNCPTMKPAQRCFETFFSVDVIKHLFTAVENH